MLRRVLTRLYVHIMHVRLEVCKVSQTIVHCGGQARSSVDPHSDAHLHKHPKDLGLMNPLGVFAGPE